MTIKIKQINENNKVGFLHKPDTDFGLDENGQTAQGYQHHDALWWNGPNTVKTKRPKTLELNSTVKHFHNLFLGISFNLINIYKPSCVLDLGGGSGLLCNQLRYCDPRITTVTVDANQLVKEKSPYIDENHFTGRTDKKLDFRDENDKKVIFDLVVSLEHFEHISEETFDTLMENIVDHTQKGSNLIFTASSWEYEEEDQKHVHCHIKSKEEWIKYINSYGFRVMPIPFALNRAGNTVEIFATRVE